MGELKPAVAMGLGLALGVLLSVAGFSLRPQPSVAPDLTPRVMQEVAFLTALEQARQSLREGRLEDAKSALERTGEGSPASEASKAQVLAALNAAQEERSRAKEAQRVASASLQQRLGEQRRGDTFKVVEAHFGLGEWDLAAQECGRLTRSYESDDDDPEVSEIHERARRLQELIPTFGRAWDEGMKPVGKGAKADASEPLVAAYRLYGEMNLRAPKLQSAMEARLGPRAADSSLSSLTTSLTRGQDRIDKLINAGLGGLDDAPPSNRELLSRQVHSYKEAARLEARAEELYRLAWVIRDRDPAEAIRKFEIVLVVTEPGSFVHENARNQLLTLALRR